MVAGAGSVCGQRLVEHPDVAKVAFTALESRARDRRRSAAATIKRVTLELGGKSANVIFADADLEQAAATARRSRCSANAGQDCCARSRILVERSALGRFMDALEDAVEAMKVGDPLDEDTRDGTADLRGPAQQRRLMRERRRPCRDPRPRAGGPGFWFPPTVLCPVSNDDRAAREEIFGPVAAVIPFRDEDEAVRLANDTIYGLSGSIWTARRRQGAAGGARDRDRRHLDQLQHLGAGDRAVRRLQAVRRGPRARAHALERHTEVKNVYYATG